MDTWVPLGRYGIEVIGIDEGKTVGTLLEIVGCMVGESNSLTYTDDGRCIVVDDVSTAIIWVGVGEREGNETSSHCGNDRS